MINFLMSGSSSQIRPSVSFLSMGRKDYKQTKYNDEIDGPSPMQILGNERAFKDKFQDKKTVFEVERDKHLEELPQKIQLLNEAKKSLYSPIDEDAPNANLKYPKEARKDIWNIRD